jgi:hypothetical protein
MIDNNHPRILEKIMNAVAHSETVIADLNAIQKHFVTEVGRFKKADVFSRFLENEELSREARDLAVASIDRMYEGLVWEDDVFGYHVVSIIDVTIIRYRMTLKD